MKTLSEIVTSRLEALKAKGVNQEAIAQRLGLDSNGLISQVKNGEKAIPYGKEDAWCDALEIQPFSPEREDFLKAAHTATLGRGRRKRGYEETLREITALRAENAALRASVIRLEGDNAQLGTDLTNALSETGSLGAELVELRKEVAELRALVGRLQK